MPGRIPGRRSGREFFHRVGILPGLAELETASTQRMAGRIRGRRSGREFFHRVGILWVDAELETARAGRMPGRIPGRKCGLKFFHGVGILPVYAVLEYIIGAENMNEPNMEQVVIMLGNGDYAEEVFKMANANERIAWLLYYLQEGQKEALFHCIAQRPQAEQEKIFKSLVALYPLSGNILIHIFQRAAGDLDDFIETYDPEERMLRELQSTVSQVAGSTRKTSRSLREYRQKIEDLQREKEERKAGLREKREAKKELAGLEQEIRELDREIEKASVTEEALQEEIREKHEELKAAQESAERQRRKLENIVKELGDIEKMSAEAAGRMPDRYGKAVEAVQKAIKELQ